MAGLKSGMAAACTALALLAQPVAAQAQELSGEAEQIRRLDIMLMVSSLRCRTTEHDFRTDYQRFSANHLGDLNAANRELGAQLASRLGAQAAKRELDRISVSMANRYGQGHPWLDCAELGQRLETLADASSRAELAAAAKELLGEPPRRVYLAAAPMLDE